MSTSNYTFHKIPDVPMTWTVTRRADGVTIGNLGRTRHGYEIQPLGGTWAETVLSRESAAGLLDSRFEALQAAPAEPAMPTFPVLTSRTAGAHTFEVVRLDRGTRRFGITLDGRLVGVEGRYKSADDAARNANNFHAITGTDSAVVDHWNRMIVEFDAEEGSYRARLDENAIPAHLADVPAEYLEEVAPAVAEISDRLADPNRIPLATVYGTRTGRNGGTWREGYTATGRDAAVALAIREGADPATITDARDDVEPVTADKVVDLHAEDLAFLRGRHFGAIAYGLTPCASCEAEADSWIANAGGNYSYRAEYVRNRHAAHLARLGVVYEPKSNTVTPRPRAEILEVQGAGTGICDDCGGSLTHSWSARVDDGSVTGTWITLCSGCLAARRVPAEQDPADAVADGEVFLVEIAAPDYVGPLTEADVNPFDLRARAAFLFRAWKSAVARHEQAVRDEDLGIGVDGAAEERERVEEGAHEYLVEFVEVHDLTYSEFDPRNSTPGVADTWIVRDRDGLVRGTHPTEAEADLHTLPGDTAEPIAPIVSRETAKYATPDYGMHGERDATEDDLSTDEALDAMLLNFMQNVDDAAEFSNMNEIASPMIVPAERCLASLRRLVAAGTVEEGPDGWRAVVDSGDHAGCTVCASNRALGIITIHYPEHDDPTEIAARRATLPDEHELRALGDRVEAAEIGAPTYTLAEAARILADAMPPLDHAHEARAWIRRVEHGEILTTI